MQQLKIEYLDIDSLKPYERNARLHSDRDIIVIANSIRRFGFKDPVGIWRKQNLIVEGHGRVLAARRLGISQIPCIRLDELTDEQRRAYALAHNRTAELSSWDERLKTLEQNDIFGVDMSELGFDLDLTDAFDGEFTEKGQQPEQNPAGELYFQCPSCGATFLEE